MWTSRELPFVATYNEVRAAAAAAATRLFPLHGFSRVPAPVATPCLTLAMFEMQRPHSCRLLLQARGRLSIWHMRPLPPEAAGIGSSFDLPVVSPLGLLQHRTPAAAAAAGAYGSPFGGSAGGFGSAGRFAGSTAGFSSAGGGGGLGATGAAAYSSSLLGPIVAGGTPRTAGGGGGKYGAMSVGAGSTARRCGAAAARAAVLQQYLDVWLVFAESKAGVAIECCGCCRVVHAEEFARQQLRQDCEKTCRLAREHCRGTYSIHPSQQTCLTGVRGQDLQF